MHHSSWRPPLLLLSFYKSPRNLLLTIHKKHDSAHNNHRESPDLPLLMGSSHIPLWSSVGKSINGCLTLAGILCTHSCSLAAPASTYSRAFFIAGLAAASMSLCSSQRCTETSLKCWQESSKRFQQAEEIPCQAKGLREKESLGYLIFYFHVCIKDSRKYMNPKERIFYQKMAPFFL